MTRVSLAWMAVVYTIAVAAAVSLSDVSGGVVFGVGYAWFAIGRAWDRLPTARTRPVKWGR